MNYQFLGYFDMTIIYLFCIFQLFYNYLTVIKIRQSKNKITWYKLSLAYAFWTYPIIYSILPMLDSFSKNLDFGFFMLWMRIPPISLTALLIISWTIYVFIHNTKVDTLKNIRENTFKYDDSNFEKITLSKNVFKKKIVKTERKYVLRIEKAQDQKEILKVVEDIQGWYISKDKFSWMWLGKRKQTHDFYFQVFQNVCFKAKEKIASIY